MRRRWRSGRTGGTRCRAIQRESGNSRHLLSVLFEYLDFHHVDREKVDVAQGLNDGINEFAMNVIPTGGNINLGTTTDVISRADLGRLASMYRLVLEAMAADFDGDASAACLPEGARVGLAGEAVEWPGGSALEMFESQAASSPELVAVVCADERLSYEELEKRSNQLARHLLGAGCWCRFRGGCVPGAQSCRPGGDACVVEGGCGVCAGRPGASCGAS
ncbi:hypothetical protein GCM10020000_13030 [Streptomyces olivoverticillatus]